MLIKTVLSKLRKRHYYALFSLLILVVVIAAIYLQNNKKIVLEPGTILVLPPQLSLEPINGQLNPYAEMEQLISLLPSSEKNTVLQAEDVIEILTRASVSADTLTDKEMKNIFQVSGASLIIDTEVSASSEGKRLTYRLHQKRMTDSGYLVGSDVDELFSQLSRLINSTTDAIILTTHTTPEPRLTHPDMVRALKQLQAGKVDAASTFLERVLVAEPSNVTTKRLLANILTDNSEFDTAYELLISAIEQAKAQEDIRELARLRLSLAHNLVGQNELERALASLSMAKKDAAKVKDWLYIAYISELSGHINQRLNRYSAARGQFKMSILYHKKIFCPYGQVQGLNNLAGLELLDRNYSQAYRLSKQALDITTRRNLTDLREVTFGLHTKVENKLQRIR